MLLVLVWPMSPFFPKVTDVERAFSKVLIIYNISLKRLLVCYLATFCTLQDPAISKTVSHLSLTMNIAALQEQVRRSIHC